jgi:hypothetical protein
MDMRTRPRRAERSLIRAAGLSEAVLAKRQQTKAAKRRAKRVKEDGSQDMGLNQSKEKMERGTCSSWFLWPWAFRLLAHLLVNKLSRPLQSRLYHRLRGFTRRHFASEVNEEINAPCITQRS